jgi:Recombinase
VKGPVVDGTKGTGALQKAADDFAASVSPMMREMRGNGLTLREIAGKLAADGIRTARGGQWTAMTVKNVLDRAA